MDIRLLDHVAINVKDLARSRDWYGRVLGFELFHQWKRTWMIKRGDMRIGLFHRPDAAPSPDLDNTVAITHFAFLTDDEGLKCAEAELTALGVSFEADDSGIAHSLFIQDPDGHLVEITSYYGPPSPPPPA